MYMIFKLKKLLIKNKICGIEMCKILCHPRDLCQLLPTLSSAKKVPYLNHCAQYRILGSICMTYILEYTARDLDQGIDWARQTTRRHTISIIPPLTSAPPFLSRNPSLLPDIGVVLDDCATSDSNVIFFFPDVLPCFTNIKTNRLHICIYQCS